MIRFLLSRTLQAVPLALAIATLVFALIHLIPGDPVEVMLGEGASPADVVALRQRLGLDRPLATQYVSFLRGLATADLGTSLYFDRPVAALVAERFPATLELALAALLVAWLVALPLGVLAAIRRHSAVDHASRLIALLGVSIPNFWLGPMLILLFAIHLDLVPVSGRDGAASLVLPALTLGTALAGLLTRMVRTSLADELGRPYLVAARARGLSRRRAVLRHGLKNALIPVVTVAGLQVGALLTGSIITETIFSWPGLGRLLIQAIRLRDYPLVQGCVLLIALSYVAANLLTDLVYGFLDPRVREE